MEVRETQTFGGFANKSKCDLCNQEPEHEVLFEKPKKMIINGLYVHSHSPTPIYTCLNCFISEIETI